MADEQTVVEPNGAVKASVECNNETKNLKRKSESADVPVETSEEANEAGAATDGLRDNSERKLREHDQKSDRPRDSARQNGNSRQKEDYRKNNRSRHFEPAPSSDAVEIREQVEFYFGDSNLPFDKFLLGLTGASENKPVPISTIHGFKRMRHFQPYSAVVNALRDSKTLNVHPPADEATEGAAETVSRKTALSSDYTVDDIKKNEQVYNDKTMSRTLYVKGFGGFDSEEDSTQRDIEAFFAPYDCNAVRLRRSKQQIFKGSVFVEFVNEDAASQFLKRDPWPTYKGHTFQSILPKQAYLEKKAEDVDDNGEPKTIYHKDKYVGRGSKRGGHGRGNFRGGRGGHAKGKGFRPAKSESNDKAKEGRAEHADEDAESGPAGKKAKTDHDKNTQDTADASAAANKDGAAAATNEDSKRKRGPADEGEAADSTEPKKPRTD